MITRRSLVTGLASALAAPAVIRTPGLLMPVRSIPFAQRVLVTPGPLQDIALARNWRWWMVPYEPSKPKIFFFLQDSEFAGSLAGHPAGTRMPDGSRLV